MGLSYPENRCLRISEISALPSLRAKLLSTVWDGILYIVHGSFTLKCISSTFLEISRRKRLPLRLRVTLKMEDQEFHQSI